MKRGSSATISGVRGDSRSGFRCPVLYQRRNENEEDAMTTEKDLVPILHEAPHLQEILAASGFTHADWEALLNSELETSH